jgi:hypothetical protein
MHVSQVFQYGSVFDDTVLHISDFVLIGRFSAGVATTAGDSRESGKPSVGDLPRVFGNAFRNVAGFSFTFKKWRESGGRRCTCLVQALCQLSLRPDRVRTPISYCVHIEKTRGW